MQREKPRSRLAATLSSKKPKIFTEPHFRKYAEELANDSTVDEVFLNCRDIGSKGITYLANALETNRSVKTVVLYEQEPESESLLIVEPDREGKDAGYCSIASVLETQNSTLRKLVIMNSPLREETFEALGATLRTNSTLKELDLGNNKQVYRDPISNTAIINLARALQVNCTLEKLSLRRVPLTESGLLSLFNALLFNTTLKELDVYLEVLRYENLSGSISNILSINGTVTSLGRPPKDSQASIPEVIKEVLARSQSRMKDRHSGPKKKLSGSQFLNIRVLEIIDEQLSRESLPDLASLKNLVSVNLCNNSFKEFPYDYFAGATGLQQISIRSNGLDEIPESLTALPSLTSLDLSFNAITSVPSCIRDMKELRFLSLRYNRINKFNVELPNALEMLDLSHNKLDYLPPHFRHLINERRVLYSNNPLASVPSAVRSGAGLVAYLEELEKGERNYSVVKLMFFGQEQVGKTTTIQNLSGKKGKSSKNLATDGIEISEWKHEDVTFRAWDFAGQLIYYTTHQLFVSSGAIYVIVFNLLNERFQSRVEYWLNSVAAHASTSPILIVGTFAEKVPQQYIDEVFDRMKKKYGARFPHIVDYIAISNVKKSNRGLREFKAKLLKHAKEWKLVDQRIPSSYHMLFERLEEEKKQLQKQEKAPLLSWERFVDMASNLNISRENCADVASFCHRIGEAAYFGHLEGLKETLFLCPQWLVDVFSSLITLKHTFVHDGHLARQDLHLIWRGSIYPQDIHPLLLDLLQKFEILHCLPSGDDILIPCLLTGGQKDEAKWPAKDPSCDHFTITRRFRFKFLPHGVFARIIVRCHQSYEVSSWNNGFIVVQPDGAKALVEFDPASYTLTIQVRGQQTSSINHFSSHLFDLVRTLVKVCFKQDLDQEEIPCIHCLRKGDEEPYIFYLRELELIVAQGSRYAYCQNTHPVRIDQLAPDIAMAEVTIIEPEHVTLGKKLGAGEDEVLLGQYNNEQVAVKVIDPTKEIGEEQGTDEEFEKKQRDDAVAEAFARFREEAFILSGLHHPNIVALKGVSFCPPRKFWMISELVQNGDLSSLLKKHRVANTYLPLALIRRIALDIAEGMAFLHSVVPRILHRDLKSPNVLLCSTDPGAPVVAKVCDFGLSTRDYNLSVNKVAANPRWNAPEVLESRNYTPKADVYSFGLVLWELFAREIPWSEYASEIFEIEGKILQGERPAMPICPTQYAELIRKCWSQKPDDRPTFQEILLDLDNFRERSDSYEESTKLSACNNPPENVTEGDSVTSDSQQPVTRISRRATISTCEPSEAVELDLKNPLFERKFKSKAREILVAGGSVWVGFEDGDVRVWKIENLGLKVLPERSISAMPSVSAMTSVELDRCEMVLAGTTNGQLFVWDAQSCTKKTKIKLGRRITAIGDVGDAVWVGNSNGKITVLSKAKMLKKVKELKDLKNNYIRFITHVPLHNAVAVAAGNDISVYNLLTDQILLRLQGHSAPICCLKFFEGQLWSSSEDKTIKLWRLEKEYPQQHTLTVHFKSVTAMCPLRASTPQSGTIPPSSVESMLNLICSGSEDSTLAFWRLNTLKCSQVVNLPSPIRCLFGAGDVLWIALEDCSVIGYRWSASPCEIFRDLSLDAAQPLAVC